MKTATPVTRIFLDCRIVLFQWATVGLLAPGCLDAAQASEQQESAVAGNSPAPAVPVKVVRYAQAVIARYDKDGDHQLDAAEWTAMQGEPASIDANGDGKISVDEYAGYIVRYAQRRRIRLMPALPTESGPLPSLLGSPEGAGASSAPSQPAGESPAPGARRFVPAAGRVAGVPDWFLQRDADGDGQLTLLEFAPRQTASALEEFARYDRDGDGVITPAEGRRGPGTGKKDGVKEQPAEEPVEAEPAATAEAAASVPPAAEAAPPAAEGPPPEAKPADAPAPSEPPRRRSRRPKDE